MNTTGADISIASGDESGWCLDVASTHGAWRHAGVRFLLRRDFAYLSSHGGYQALSGVAQWLACWAHNPKVRGSKPRSAVPNLGATLGLEPGSLG